jgi:hypothetical protein
MFRAFITNHLNRSQGVVGGGLMPELDFRWAVQSEPQPLKEWRGLGFPRRINPPGYLGGYDKI